MTKRASEVPPEVESTGSSPVSARTTSATRSTKGPGFVRKLSPEISELMVKSTPLSAEIAAAFHVSPNTIKSQLKSLYRKLGCSTREEAINAALRLHLIRAAGDIVEGAGRSR